MPHAFVPFAMDEQGGVVMACDLPGEIEHAGPACLEMFRRLADIADRVCPTLMRRIGD